MPTPAKPGSRHGPGQGLGGGRVSPLLIWKRLGRPSAPERPTILKGRCCQYGTMFFDDGGGERHRDLLPIPMGAELKSLLGSEAAWGTSTSAKRRAASRRRQDDWPIDGISALNELGGQGRHVPNRAPLTAAQRAAVRRLATTYGRWSPPVDRPSPHAARSTPQGLRPGYSEVEASGARTVYQRGSISLPKIGAGKVDLTDVFFPRSAFKAGDWPSVAFL